VTHDAQPDNSHGLEFLVRFVFGGDGGLQILEFQFFSHCLILDVSGILCPPPERAAFAAAVRPGFEVGWFLGLKRTERTVQEVPAWRDTARVRPGRRY
jgi:hypothetical protein